MADLLTPITIGPHELSNRIFMAPMTRNRAPDTVANAMMKTYYTQRTDVGLIISEGAQISPQAVGYPATPGIHNEEQVTGWRAVTDAVHQHGGHIFCQLWHVGRISHPDLQPDGALPVAPSAIKPSGKTMTNEGLKSFETPRALRIDEIPGVIADYIHAADCALRAGFDGVEIHAANGYLMDQFLRNGSNQRTDAYGGTFENRTRLLLEVVEAVSSVWGKERVGVRLSPLQPFNDMYDSNPEGIFTHVVKELNHLGLAYLHITEKGRQSPGAAGPAFELSVLRKLWHGVYITNADYDKARGNATIARSDADAITFGIPFIANPDLVSRFKQDAPLNEADPTTFYGGDEQGYIDYPMLNDV